MVSFDSGIVLSRTPAHWHTTVSRSQIHALEVPFVSAICLFCRLDLSEDTPVVTTHGASLLCGFAFSDRHIGDDNTKCLVDRAKKPKAANSFVFTLVV